MKSAGMARQAIGIVVCSFVLAAATDAAAQASLSRCTIEGQAGRCGSVAVPEDHRKAGGRTLSLPVVILEKTGSEERREPILVLVGGPGQAATGQAEWAASVLATARRSRDIVLIDQRGTGGASRLGCALAPRTFFVPADPERCLARLSRKAALELYGTESFVEDLELARKSLGYDRIVLFGASYGTRAAYAYARRYPDSVKAAILLAPAPIAMPVLDSFAEDGRHSLDAIVADCLANEDCARAFPGLRPDVERFRRTTTDPYRLIGLQFLQYSTSTAMHLPRIISEAAKGNLTPLDAAIGEFRERLVDQLAIGLHLTIICGEDLSFGAREKPSIVRQEYARACGGWPAAAVSPGFHDARRVSAPALVLVGERDPVTSPRWARDAAGQFSPGQLVILPKAGHIPVGFERCIGRLVADFLERRPADASCVSDVRRPAYVLR